MTDTPLSLPVRHGTSPATTATNPHKQLEQTPSRELYDELAERMYSVPDAHEEPSKISVPGARALILDDDIEAGPGEAFIIDREFCHLHPPDDGSLHMALPQAVAEQARAQGWAELHPVAKRGMIPETVVMVYAPRDTEELAVVERLIQVSHRFAGGTSEAIQ